MKSAPNNDFWAELGWMWERFRKRIRSALALSLAFKALNLVVLAPLTAVILRFCLLRWGRASVGNFELVSFFGSPVGLVALLGVGALLLGSLYLELSALIRLLADDRLHWWQAFQSSTRLFPRLVHLGLRQVALYLVLAVPFLAAVGVVYWLFWSGKDLNGLIILKPPEFWWGAALAAVIAAAYGTLALHVFLRRLYSVPILTFEPAMTVSEALRESIKRSRGTFWRCTGAIVAWAVIQCLLSAIFLGALQMVANSIVSGPDASLARAALLAGSLLGVQLLVATILSAVANLSLAGVILSLYRHVAPSGALPAGAPAEKLPSQMSIGWILGAALLALSILSPVISALAIGNLNLEESLEITAHRAGATAAPENTVAALKQAIEDRADWAEIDVQLTSDKALVVMHDIDLARVGGGQRRVDQATFAEIRELDVGSAFGPQFAGERIPTLKEILTAASDKIRLNVELKPHSVSDGEDLTRRVIAELREAKMIDRCRLCSQSYESLQLARQLEPGLDVGYIVATAIGDPAKLDVNFLMVKSTLITRALVDRARLRNITVHAWTVNDPAQVGPLLDTGLANLITDDPARIRNQLDEIRALSAPQRILLRAHHALAR
jgi:glycerophosphoryl diester phosphodiesterase